jgi:tRNA 2-selenouridine synthase
MFLEVTYEDIDKNRINGSYKLIDLRSPSEYKSETIPGAVNIPIFTDEERKIIGTTYVQESIDKAKLLGVKAASKKLPAIYEQVSQLDKKYNNLIFFCARGGFRSSSVTGLFRTIGINAIKLDGGYKGYRRYVNDNLPKLIEDITFVVLYGNTGTGKTEILKNISEKGYDILDLESSANHRGSTLGGVGLGEPNTQKMFESYLFEALKNRKYNLVFTEGESKKIGKAVIPDYLFDKIRNGINIYISAPMEKRIENILNDYVHNTDNELIEALEHLRRYLGHENINRYIEMIRNKEYKRVIEELIIKYYDPRYESNKRIYVSNFYNLNTNNTANEIINFFKPKIIESSISNFSE